MEDNYFSITIQIPKLHSEITFGRTCAERTEVVELHTIASPQKFY